MTRSGSAYYYMADGLGSIRNIGESDEDTANTYDYYAFGDSLGTQTQGVTNPYRYTAREYESGSVLDTYYYRNRYYLSALGIFASRDIVEEDIVRGFRYVGNSPTMKSDPTGLKPPTWGEAVLACAKAKKPELSQEELDEFEKCVKEAMADGDSVKDAVKKCAKDKLKDVAKAISCCALNDMRGHNEEANGNENEPADLTPCETLAEYEKPPQGSDKPNSNETMFNKCMDCHWEKACIAGNWYTLWYYQMHEESECCRKYSP